MSLLVTDALSPDPAEFMFPLKAILVNVSQQLLPTLRQAVHNHPAVSEGEFNRASDALDNCRWTKDEARLLIFHLKGIEDLEDLQRLKRNFAEWPILAVVDGCEGRSFNLLLLANRAGAAQVVPTPLDEEDFRLALDGIGQNYGFVVPNAKMIAVSGVTGGCGATTIALNLAYQIVAKTKKHTILAEMAFQKGTLATYLNVDPKYVIHDLLANSVKLDMHLVQQALTNIEANFDILSGPHRQIMPLDVSPIDVNRLLDYLRRLCHLVVLDVPCSNNEVYIQTLAAADQVVLVAEQNLPSLRSLGLVLDMLGGTNLWEAPGRPLDGRRIHLVVNRYDSKSEEYSLKGLEQRLQVKKLLPVGNDYKAVNAAMHAGKPLKVQSPRARIVQDIDNLVTFLMSHGEKKEAVAVPKMASSGLFTRIARAFGLSA